MRDATNTGISKGVLSKEIVTIDNKKHLVKGNTKGGFEPFSEVMASIIVDEMKLYHIAYTLQESKNFPNVEVFNNIKYVSICEISPKKFTSYVNSMEKQLILKGFSETGAVDMVDSLKYYKETGLSKDHPIKMLSFDAFIGNIDRHLNNFDIYYDDSGIHNAPIIDNGLSLYILFMEIDKVLEFSNGDIGPDKSRPYRDTHEIQIWALEGEFGDIAILEIDDPDTFLERVFNRFKKEVFPFMETEERKKSIINYLKARYPVYIQPYLKKNIKWV